MAILIASSTRMKHPTRLWLSECFHSGKADALPIRDHRWKKDPAVSQQRKSLRMRWGSRRNSIRNTSTTLLLLVLDRPGLQLLFMRLLKGWTPSWSRPSRRAGRPGSSSRIENYLGFPTGISGQMLAARAQVQAQKFGARLIIARSVSGSRLQQPAIFASLSTTARRSRPAASSSHPGHAIAASICRELSRFEGQRRALRRDRRSKAAFAHGKRCDRGGRRQFCGPGSHVFLSRQGATCAHMLVRGDGLTATMSDYLITRIENSPSITLHLRSEVTGLFGEKYLEKPVHWREGRKKKSRFRQPSCSS